MLLLLDYHLKPAAQKNKSLKKDSNDLFKKLF